SGKLDKINTALENVKSTCAPLESAFKDITAAANPLGVGFESIRKAVLTLAKKLPAVNKAAERTNKVFQKLKTTTPALGKSFEELNKALAKVEPKIGSSASLLLILAKAALKVHRASEKMSSGVNNLNTNLGTLHPNLQQAADNADRLSSVFNHAQDSVEKMKKPFGDLSDALSEVGGHLTTMGAALTGVVGTVAGGAAYAVKAAMELDTSKAALANTLTGNATQSAAQMRELQKKAQSLGVALPGSTKDMMEMFTELRQQGVSVKTILGGLGEATAQFATLCGRDFQSSAIMVAKFAESLGISADKASEVVDVLQRVKGATGLTEDQLFETFKYVAPSLQSLKIVGQGKKDAPKEVAAIIGMLSKSGIEASMAGTGMAQALQRMSSVEKVLYSKKFGKYRKIMRDQGITLDFFDAKGSFKGLDNMVKQLDKLKAFNDQDQLNVVSMLFGDVGGRAMQAIIQRGHKGFTEVTQEMGAQKSMQEKISTIMNTTAMKWETFGGQTETAVQLIGTKLTEHFKLPSLLDKVCDKLDEINAWIDDPKNADKIDGYIEKATKILSIIGGIGAALTGLGVSMTVTAGAMQAIEAFKKFHGTINGVSGALRMLATANAWLLAIGLVALLVIKYWKPLTTLFKAIGRGFMDSFGKKFPQLIAQMQPAIDQLKSWFNWLLTPSEDMPFLDPIGEKIGNLLASVAGFGLDHIGNITAKVAKFGQLLGTATAYLFDGGWKSDWDAVCLGWKQFWRDMGTALYLVWDDLTKFLGNTWDKISTTFSNVCTTIYNTITSLGERLFTAGQNLVNSIVDGIKSKYSAVTDTVGKLAQDIRDFFPFSPAKRGPLRDLNRIKFGETVASSIKADPVKRAINVASNKLESPLNTVSQTSAAVNSAKNNVSVNYAPVINMNGGGEEAVAAVLAELRRHPSQLMAIIDSEMAGRERVSFA
ncbi:TPA: phage tail tape measure protein, partial [bacterium UBP9_UBA11836]|nr:phage tail tape measure protein [bacterium UBP9_UBA11836]